MAKKETKKPDFENSMSNDWETKYTGKTDFYKNEEEYKKIGELQERYQILRESKLTNCYWGRDGGYHKSWHKRWDYHEKLGNGWHAAFDPDDPQPNLKSQFVLSAVQTTLAEMRQQEFLPAGNPWTTKGQKFSPIVENIVSFPWYRYDWQDILIDAQQEAVWKGMAFLKMEYTTIERKVKLRKLKDFTEEEIKQMEDTNDYIWEEKTITEHDDVNLIHIPLTEYFPDNFARYQHGVNFAAVDGIYTPNMSYSGFLAKYQNMKGIFNINKVKPGNAVKDNDNPIFRLPEGIRGTDNVFVQEWENKAKDFKRIVANGVLIYDGPMPDNHKQLSIVCIGCYKLPHQYYYMGLADILEGLQTEDEVYRNKFIKLLELSLEPPIIANNTVAGEFGEQYDKAEAGDIISISGSPQEIQWMQPPMSRLSELLGLRAQIKEDAITVSLIDPKASSLPTNTPTAFEAMQTTQATLKSFAMVLKSIARGVKVLYELQWALQKQEYPLRLTPQEIEDRKGDEGIDLEKEKKHEIMLKGVQIIDQEGEIQITKHPGKMFPFELKEEYFDLETGDIDFTVDPESMVPNNRAYRAKQSQDMFAQLMPIAQNPQLLANEKVMYLVKKVGHDLDWTDIDDFLGTLSEGDDDSIDRAVEQEKLMSKNSKLGIDHDKYEDIIGIPGEPLPHLNHHLEYISALNQLLATKQQQLNDEVEKLMGDAVHNGVIGKPDERRQKEISELSLFLNQLKSHYSIDMMTFDAAQNQLLAQQAGMPPGQQQIGPDGQPQSGMQQQPGTGMNPAMSGHVPPPGQRQMNNVGQSTALPASNIHIPMPSGASPLQM